MTDVDQVLRRDRPRTLIAVAAALVVVALVGGCGSDEADSSSAADKGAVPVYFVDDKGLLVAVDQEIPGSDKMSSQGRALAATEALITDAPAEGSGLKSHWGGSCGVGAGVESLQKQSGLITIKVRGATGVICDRKGAAEEQQRQQLAWTVVENMGGSTSTPVRMYGPNGALIYDNLVADDKFLAG